MYLSIASLATLCLAVPLALAQGQTAHHHEQSVTPIVDGAKHPELISDEEAIAMFFTVIALPPNPSPEQMSSVSAKIHRINLAAVDREILIEEAKAYHVDADPLRLTIQAINNAHTTMGKADFETRNSAGIEVERCALRHFTKLLSGISPEGKEKLRAHIAYIKTKMKIIPPPKM